MGFKNIVLLIALGVMLATLGLCYYAGMFERVDIEECNQGPFHLVYREHIGSYNEIRYVMADVYAYLKFKKKIPVSRGFSMFYDTPSKTVKKDMHYIGGCVVDSAFAAIDTPYHQKTIVAAPAIVASVKLRSFLSYSTASLKAYPALERRRAEKGITLSGPVMELYDMPQKKIFYIAFPAR